MGILCVAANHLDIRTVVGQGFDEVLVNFVHGNVELGELPNDSHLALLVVVDVFGVVFLAQHIFNQVSQHFQLPDRNCSLLRIVFQVTATSMVYLRDVNDVAPSGLGCPWICRRHDGLS